MTSSTGPDPATTAPAVAVALHRRLVTELGDEATAATIAGGLDAATLASIEALTGGAILDSSMLDYAPSTVPLAEVGSLWAFAYGYRFSPEAAQALAGAGGVVPPMDALIPGPNNEALARIVADLVAERSLPVIAQWEIARVLADLGVERVISVEPDIAADGTVTYLSTAGVARKGLRMAEDAGVVVGHAGVLGFADHAVRCVMTARAEGMTADVPEGVDLPSTYDPESGQTWTRARSSWIPVDLLARTILAG